MEKKAAFKIPDEQARKAAIGSLTGGSNLINKAIAAIVPHFKPVPKPGPSDWLTEHKEAGQTYDTYIKSARNPVTSQRKTIYIQPLEESIDEEFLMTLKAFTEAFYVGLEVVTRPLINLKGLNVGNRINEWTEKLQYNAGEILKALERQVPSDAYCMIAVCMTDLYPRDAWNFVFGLASLRNRVGVFSFARYDETFFAQPSEELKPTDKGIIIWRSCKVMVHEIGHMFGLSHCIYFHCLMNGSNHFEESNNKPLFLCPVCLRKLQSTIGFNIAERYKKLSETCAKLGSKFDKVTQQYELLYNAVMQSYGSNYQSTSPKSCHSSNLRPGSFHFKPIPKPGPYEWRSVAEKYKKLSEEYKKQGNELAAYQFKTYYTCVMKGCGSDYQNEEANKRQVPEPAKIGATSLQQSSQASKNLKTTIKLTVLKTSETKQVIDR